MAVAYFSGSEGRSPHSIASREQASDRVINSTSSLRPPAAELTKSIERESPRQLLGSWTGAPTEPTPAGIRLHGAADGLTILFAALVAGTTLSSEFDADAWSISASNAVLTNTLNEPPKEVVGPSDLLPDRWPTVIDWVAASRAVPNSVQRDSCLSCRHSSRHGLIEKARS
jgi:hypothetical protein